MGRGGDSLFQGLILKGNGGYVHRQYQFISLEQMTFRSHGNLEEFKSIAMRLL